MKSNPRLPLAKSPVRWAILLCATVLSAQALSVVSPPDPAYTPLHAAAEKCDAGQVRATLQALPHSGRSAALDRLDRDGYTPLGYAARAGCLEVVTLLVQAGATVDLAASHNGWTPLLQAADQRHAEVVRYLLEHGAKPDARTSLGKTPLGVALDGSAFSNGPKGDRDATVKVLLAHGADAAPLLATHDELAGVASTQQHQLDDLQAERVRQAENIRQLLAGRNRLEQECRRLEAECQRLKGIIEQIRNATGNPGYRPS